MSARSAPPGPASGRAERPGPDASRDSQEPDWHALDSVEVEARLGSRPTGLAGAEATLRLARHGPNRLAPPRRRGPLRRLLRQFHNLLIYVMLAASAIAAALGHWVDSGVMLSAVIVNVIVGFIQEGRAENALDAIRRMLAPHATVIRDGERHEIDAADLVPGDRVLVASGDRIPGDLRLVATRELRVDESALTGESLPVGKSTDAVDPAAPLGDRFGMAYSGTLVVHGTGEGIVVATGKATELGRINRLLSDVEVVATPLLRQVNRFGRLLALAIVALCAATYLYGTLARGLPSADMFLMAVALAVSAIPEGLPALMTVTLALGVQRMARRNAIVRRLPAVEALGSVTVICSDKTGTLTRNEMTVRRVVSADRIAEVDGYGYEPTGALRSGAEALDPAAVPALELALRAGVLCNDAALRDTDGRWSVEGDPTEGALLVLGRKAGLDQAELAATWPRLDAIPFESQRRFMATAHRDPEGNPWLFAKGAPERILDLCADQLGAEGRDPLDVDFWRRMIDDTAAHGLRLLAIACRRAAPVGERLGDADVAGGFTMLALVGIIDPPREEAIEAVADCHRAGIRVKMITGDHAETARAIGAQLSIGTGGPAITGAEIATMDEASLRRAAREVDVFARASPEHKLRLVRALQEEGEIVAMTGDGVNDAPALKRADVGVAMGMKGTEAAKEAADVVLADDNFSTIAAAVREGRAVYDNVRKFVLFVLPTNGGEALVVIAAILSGLALPMTPAQVLWINMVTAGFLGLALAFEPAEPGLMSRRPRPPGESLVTPFFAWRILFVSILIAGGSLGLFLTELAAGKSLETARTMAVSAIVMAEMFYLLNSRFVLAPVTTIEGLTGNRYVLGAILACLVLQLGFVHLPALQAVFGSVPLGAGEWAKVVGAGLLVFSMAELEKFLLRRTGLSGRLSVAKPAV